MFAFNSCEKGYLKYNPKRAKIHKSCIKTNYWSILESFQSRGLQHLLVSTLTVSKQWTDNLQARTSNQRSKNLQARELILILLTTNAGWEQTVIKRSGDTELKYFARYCSTLHIVWRALVWGASSRMPTLSCFEGWRAVWNCVNNC